LYTHDPYLLTEFVMDKVGDNLQFEAIDWMTPYQTPELTLAFSRRSIVGPGATTFPGNKISGMGLDVFQKGNLSGLKVKIICQAFSNLEDNLSLCRQYGWSFKKLDVGKFLTDDFAKILDSVTEKKGSKLTSLVLDAVMLSSDGVECMTRVIDRSQMLESFDLKVRTNVDKAYVEKLVYLLGRHKERLRSWVLWCNEYAQLPEFVKTFPTSLEPPNLEYFRVVCQRDTPLPRACAQWIASIVHSSTRAYMSAPSQAPQGDSLNLQSFESADDMPGPCRPTEGNPSLAGPTRF